MKVEALIRQLKRVLKNEGNIEVVMDYETGMSGGTTTVENLFTQDYTFQGEKKPERVVRLTL